MNKVSDHFNWNHARAFLVTAKTGSLSKAAEALSQSQPTIGRQISALENALGVLLFDRVGNSLHITPKGQDLLKKVEIMQDAANDLSASVRSASDNMSGHVTLTLSDNFAIYFAPKLVERLAQIAPNITLDIHAENAVEDLTRREADIAIRHIRPNQNDLIAKSLGAMRAKLYAHQDYLDKMGRPQSEDAVGALEMIGFGDVKTHLERAREYGVSVLPDHIHYASNSGIVAWELAKVGLGCLYMADKIASTAPMMEAILPEETVIEFPVWIVTHGELQMNSHIRTVFDLLVELFSQD